MKILAMYYNELHGDTSYGYGLWNNLKETFHCYLEPGYVRDVYRHLESLTSSYSYLTIISCLNSAKPRMFPMEVSVIRTER